MSTAMLAQPASIAAVLAALHTAQTEHRLFPTPGRARCPIVVGVSGGADSVCLLHALATLAAAWGLTLHVAHLDHALRPASADDAAFVAELTARLGLPFHTARLAPGALAQRPGGLEAAARAARYDVLAQVARAVGDAGPATVAVAHHLDDQAETVLLRLIQGSGLTGLSGMAWRSPLPGAPDVTLARPLLALPRAALRDYLIAAGLSWREDATNQDTDRTRNAIRQDILPRLARLNPNIVAALAATADRLAAEAARAAQADAAALDDLLFDGDAPADRLVLDLDRLLTADLATRRGVLRLALHRLGVDGRDAGHAAVERILTRVAQTTISGGPYPLLANIVWSVTGATPDRPALLSLHRRDVLPLTPAQPLIAPGLALPAPVPPSGNLSLADGWELHSAVCTPADLPAGWRDRRRPWRAFLDADVAADLALTVPGHGMRVAPLGMAGHTRSLGDLFTDHKVPAAYRRAWPVVVEADRGDVVWVCGLALSERVALQPDTRRVRCLTWQMRGADRP